MRAVVQNGYGAPGDVLELRDIPTPQPGEGEALVRVHAASVNAVDFHLVRGAPYIARLSFGLRRPRNPVPGCDLAGVVEAVGSGVTTLRPGDEVFGTTFMGGFGAFAECAVVPAELLAVRPAAFTHAQAAALPLAALTALQALRDHGEVASGDRVLIIGASGGVGSFAVQIANGLGAEVTGVCSTRNADLVGSLGADRVLDYTRKAIDRGYDLIVQLAGTATASELRRSLTPKGRLVMISGDAPGRWIGPLGRALRGQLQSPFVSQTIASFTVAPSAAGLSDLAELVNAGSLTPVVDRTCALDEAAEAIAQAEQGHTRGKVVVAV
jgi:NADPH:quinone reductase-like Zn-dependent oxidoreductase